MNTQPKTSVRLDWTRLLGFDQIARTPDSVEPKVGEKPVVDATGIGPKVGAKPGFDASAIGPKVGEKPSFEAGLIGPKVSVKPEA